ncbi:MAG: BON domain-containing protein [Deltaproteobacteria bacterium]|nr:BON domain-containing protein [Deltaproteobacteria bacterium]
MTKHLFAAALAISSIAACKSDSNGKPAADNTARNDRDQSNAKTADNAVNNSSDLDLTQQIRKAVMDDGTLSTNAHNCKIVVQNGAVTLVGPVASADEKARVASIAAKVVGGDGKVTNQLEVTN